MDTLTKALRRAAAARTVQQRRDAGLPSWAHRIDLTDVFHDPAMTFPKRRDAIAARLANHPWVRNDQTGELAGLVDELRGYDDPDDFDMVWDAIYDRADADRVWIATR